MSYQELPIDVLLERVAEMPDIEAEHDLVLRKEKSALEVAMLQGELRKANNKNKSDIGRALQVMGQDNLRINAALKMTRQRMDAKSWSKAVMAVCGPELFARCREWMAAQP